MSAFVPRSALAAGHSAGRRRAALPLLLLVVSLALILTAFEAARPAPALALSTFATKCDGVVLRSRPYTSSTKMATLSKGIKVVAVDKVSGGSWRTTCAGSTATGSSWYKITVANGKDVRTRFGVSAVYAASSLFKKLYSMSYKKAACDGVNIRSSASTSGSKKATLSAGTKVTVIGTVSGGSWSATCAGDDVSGSSWYKINQVNGKSTSSLYGVSAVYGAKGLFTSLSSDTPASNPTPPPSSTPNPTPTPSPTSGYMEGIDVSHWQETIDWVKVAAAGKKFAFLKATESTDFLDNKYATNRSKAKANGIKVGAYHFARPGTNTNDAVNEANWFIKNAAPISGELLPVLDLEVTGWPVRRPARGLDQGVHGPGLRADRRQGRDLRLAQLLVEQRRQLHQDRRRRLQGPVDRPLDDRLRADRAGQQLERQRLDVLAVHVERVGERDQRPGRPQPLPVQRPGQGAHPLSRGTGGRSPGALRPSPMLLRHGDGRHHRDAAPARR